MKGQSTMGIPDGTRLGPYEILSPIGSGGMGEVYRAYDVRLRRPVAIKTLPASCSSDEMRLRLFNQEARALASINHPNIVTLYGLGDPADGCYIVMELVEGGTLRQELLGGRKTLQTALDVGTQLTSALAAAHLAGIVHCDIKPENVMIRPDGLVKLLDFGLATLTQPHKALKLPSVNDDVLDRDRHLIDGVCPSTSTLYVTIPNVLEGDDIHQRVLGTATYMSPEHLCGEDVDERTDIFSLGVTLYELIAGVAPFGGSTRAQIIDAILEREAPPLSWYRPAIPAALEHIIRKTLRKHRDCRYQNTKELLIDLRDVKQEWEFEATLKRSAQYELIKQPKATTAAQCTGEMIQAGSIQSCESGVAEGTSGSRVIPSEIVEHRPTAETTSILPTRASLGILPGLTARFRSAGC